MRVAELSEISSSENWNHRNPLRIVNEGDEPKLLSREPWSSWALVGCDSITNYSITVDSKVNAKGHPCIYIRPAVKSTTIRAHSRSTESGA